MAPARSLAIPNSPGTEGLAEQVAFKVAAGLFDHDISKQVRPIGMVLHLAYGSLWGLAYGMAQESTGLPPPWLGVLHGLAVYSAGPGCLIPAMHISRMPPEEPRERASLLFAGHLVYGLCVAYLYRSLRAGRLLHLDITGEDVT